MARPAVHRRVDGAAGMNNRYLQKPTVAWETEALHQRLSMWGGCAGGVSGLGN